MEGLGTILENALRAAADNHAFFERGGFFNHVARQPRHRVGIEHHRRVFGRCGDSLVAAMPKRFHGAMKPRIHALVATLRLLAADPRKLRDTIDEIVVDELPTDLAGQMAGDFGAAASKLTSYRNDPRHHFTVTAGSTDIPGRSKCCGSCPLLKRMRTGIRCTTFT